MTKILFIVGLLIGIAAGGTYIATHVSAGCYDFWPFKGSACVVTTK